MSSIGRPLARSLSPGTRSSSAERVHSSTAITGGNEPKQPYQHFGSDKIAMPHMPLDTEIHWEWRNPLNLIPAVLLGIIVLDLVALVL
jgi:hypothetical protein